ncbi:MAG: spore coat protein CotJB [Eubacteriales bacterium]
MSNCLTNCTDPEVDCTKLEGVLPSCAGLAVPYVAFQQENPEKYTQREALSNGTLYPALNLPFHLQVAGGTLAQTPLVELQALCFVITELGHYLDTHQDDAEAFELFKEYVALEATARTEYEATYGPLTRPATASKSTYCWLNSPWPWNYDENEVT